MHVIGKLQSKPNENFPSLRYSGTGDKWFGVHQDQTTCHKNWDKLALSKAMLYQFIQAENLGKLPCEIPLNSSQQTPENCFLSRPVRKRLLPLWKSWFTDINMRVNQHKYTYIATSRRAGWEQKCYRMPRVYFISPSLVFSLILLVFQNSRQPHQPDTAMSHIRHESKSPLTPASPGLCLFSPFCPDDCTADWCVTSSQVRQQHKVLIKIKIQ